MGSKSSTEHSDLDYSEVLRACREGEEQAWRTLYDAFNPRIHGVAAAWGIYGTAAEDVVQETFLKLITSISQIRNVSSLSSYICRSAQHVCIDRHRIRKTRKRGGGVSDVSLDDLVIDRIRFPESERSESDDERKKYELVLLCLKDLDDTDRLLIERHHIKNEPINDIAKDLRVRAGTLAVRLHRGMQKLRKQVKLRFGELDA